MISYTSLFSKTVCIYYNARYTRSKSTNKITINKLIENKDSIQLTIENVKKIISQETTFNESELTKMRENQWTTLDFWHTTQIKKKFSGTEWFCKDEIICAMARRGLTITLIWIVLMTSGGFINNYKYTYVYGVKIDIKQLLLCTMQVHVYHKD